ncbi:MAG: penicillin-binding protein 1C, partial [Ignavibacteriales bacterium]|nr:penicillin-binding protein 1C [Ignavibacteriales bacterium]
MNRYFSQITQKLIEYSKTKYVRIGVIIVVCFFLLDILFPLPNTKPYSREIVARDNTLLTAYLSTDSKWRLKTNLEDVSPDLLKAIIEKEDKWYDWHFGFNPISIFRALYSNIISGETVSGASTISMQVIRLLEPRDRNIFSKFIEMFRSFQLELHYTKEEILEMYMSHLPFGGNIEGVKSASYIYFDRPPNKLSLAQSILLTIIPNDPNSRRLDRKFSDIKKYRDYWIGVFQKNDVFPKSDLTDAKYEPIEFARHSIVVEAPHFCQMINRKYTGDKIVTTLDLKIQHITEKLLSNYVNRVKSKGVTNGAVIIIDNKNSEVVAYCGSSDFYDSNYAGQVNGITSVRSPGSTLKPALYALALDLGLMTPKMRLLDIPTDFSGYIPENYDRKFNGSVTFEFALINSLNIPAVRLLRMVGFSQFVSLLSKADFNSIRKNEKNLGLSLILGGCGVTLEELTRLFTAFARDGKIFKLNYIINNEQDEGVQLFSKGAAYLIGIILLNNQRPDFPNQLSDVTKLPKIAWKTGTSYGKRDAWAVGFNPQYTIGVWMGNFNGKGSPYLSGAEMSVPLLFDLFNAISYGEDKKWFDMPNDILERDVCAETGLLPTEQCKNLVLDFYIKNVSPNLKCDLYKE